MTDLLDRAAVAKLLNVDPATVSSYVSRGQMPPPDLRLGSAPVWYRETVERWMRSRRGQGWRRQAVQDD